MYLAKCGPEITFVLNYVFWYGKECAINVGVLERTIKYCAFVWLCKL